MKDSELACDLNEDNMSCITISEGQNVTARTKYISLKYHWFRSFIKGPNKLLNVKYINKKEQTTDIFTKPLDESSFLHLRKKSNGW